VANKAAPIICSKKTDLRLVKPQVREKNPEP
jgi:hypothetical protein